MNCPTCNIPLSEVSIEQIQLDVCKEGCGGIWFDRFELQKMDEQHEFTDANLLEVLSIESPANYDQSEKRECPKCKGIVMMKHFFSKKLKLIIAQNVQVIGLTRGNYLKLGNNSKPKKRGQKRRLSILQNYLTANCPK